MDIIRHRDPKCVVISCLLTSCPGLKSVAAHVEDYDNDDFQPFECSLTRLRFEGNIQRSMTNLDLFIECTGDSLEVGAAAPIPAIRVRKAY